MHDALPEIDRLRAALEQERAANRQLVTECDALNLQRTNALQRLVDATVENAAMRPIVTTVAQSTVHEDIYGFGDHFLMLYDETSGQGVQQFITQARAFVVAHPTAEQPAQTAMPVLSARVSRSCDGGYHEQCGHCDCECHREHPAAESEKRPDDETH